MELCCQILLYFDSRRILNDMKNSCEQFLENLSEKEIPKYPPLRHLLEINVMDLLDKTPEGGEALLKEPLRWQNICRDILYACLLTIDNEWTQSIKLTQVGVNIRLTLPVTLAQPNSNCYRGLVSFQGLLLSVSKSESYAYHTVWSCPEECEGSEEILHYIPKVPPKCFICKSVLFENCGLRRCGEQAIATVKIKNTLQSKHFKIVDDMINKVNLGSIYIFHTVILKKVITVWSFEEILSLAAPITNPIPNDIEELYLACKGVPWKFIYCLASSIGINVCPLNCFMHLKIGLLLSLTSVKANLLTDSRIVHVFAAGYDTGFVGQIMIEAAKLAEPVLCLGTSNSTVETTLLGSSRGICMLPLPFQSYNQKQISAILSTLETGEISTNIMTAKLRCAVWAQGMDCKKVLLFNVANVFGSICRGDYGEYNDEIVEFLLQRALEPSEIGREEIKSLEDIASYIDLVAGIKVSIDICAEGLLRNYFLAARKDRPRGVSVGSMGVLVATCVTSARLCRRSIANIDDAVLAIWLHVSGSPEPRFAPDEYLQTPANINNLQKIFKHFKTWLAEFTGYEFSLFI